MRSKDKIFEKYDYLSPKLNLCYNTSLSQPQDNDNNYPIIKLLNNFEEIKSIIKLNDLNYINFLYLNSLQVNRILYINEEIIKIKNKKDLAFIFFVILSLLISENPDVINYSYSSSLINYLNDEQLKLKNEIIKKIIIAKIIIELIANYENNDNNDEKNEIDLDRIKKHNREFIQKNIDKLKEFTITKENISKIKIDEIYSKIIKYLIENKKLDDSDETTEKIIKQIDLKSFNLTKSMLENLSEILNKDKDYLKEFIIKEYDDLFNDKIINFYYTLVKYIIKNNFYIFQIPFLLETRNIIKILIKKNLVKFYNSIKLKKDEKNKIETFLGAFIEYKYYLYKSIKVIKENENNSSMNSSYMNSINNNRNNNNNYGLNNNISISNSQSSGFFSSPSYEDAKKNSQRGIEYYDIGVRSEYEELENTYKDDPVFKILSKSSFKFEFIKTKNTNVECKCSEISIKDKIKKISLDEIKTFTSENEILNNNYKKFLKVFENIIDKIKEGIFVDIDFTLTLIFIGNKVESSIFQIDCTYKLKKKYGEFEYIDNNILETEVLNGIGFLIEEIKG